MDANEKAEKIYIAVYGHLDDKVFRSAKMQEIADWLGDSRAPLASLIAEWREYDADDVAANPDIGKAAAVLGRKGGSSTSQAKGAAARENGKRGGRPRKMRYIWSVPGVSDGECATAVECGAKIAEVRKRVGRLHATITDTHGWYTYTA